MVAGTWWWQPVGFGEDACKIRKQGLQEVFVRGRRDPPRLASGLGEACAKRTLRES
jgi:hypothetical protein